MASYKELIAQKQALEAQIEQARKSEVADAVLQVRALIADFGLTADDVFGKSRVSAAAGKSVPPKYRNAATGETWTGRGKAPKWIADQDRDQFLIA